MVILQQVVLVVLFVLFPLNCDASSWGDVTRLYGSYHSADEDHGEFSLGLFSHLLRLQKDDHPFYSLSRNILNPVGLLFDEMLGHIRSRIRQHKELFPKSFAANECMEDDDLCFASVMMNRWRDTDRQDVTELNKRTTTPDNGERHANRLHPYIRRKRIPSLLSAASTSSPDLIKNRKRGDDVEEFTAGDDCEGRGVAIGSLSNVCRHSCEVTKMRCAPNFPRLDDPLSYDGDLSHCHPVEIACEDVHTTFKSWQVAEFHLFECSTGETDEDAVRVAPSDADLAHCAPLEVLYFDRLFNFTYDASVTQQMIKNDEVCVVDEISPLTYCRSPRITCDGAVVECFDSRDFVCADGYISCKNVAVTCNGVKLPCVGDHIACDDPLYFCGNSSVFCHGQELCVGGSKSCLARVEDTAIDKELGTVNGVAVCNGVGLECDSLPISCDNTHYQQEDSVVCHDALMQKRNFPSHTHCLDAPHYCPEYELHVRCEEEGEEEECDGNGWVWRDDFVYCEYANLLNITDSDSDGIVEYSDDIISEGDVEALENSSLDDDDDNEDGDGGEALSQDDYINEMSVRYVNGNTLVRKLCIKRAAVKPLVNCSLESCQNIGVFCGKEIVPCFPEDSIHHGLYPSTPVGSSSNSNSNSNYEDEQEDFSDWEISDSGEPMCHGSPVWCLGDTQQHVYRRPCRAEEAAAALVWRCDDVFTNQCGYVRYGVTDTCWIKNEDWKCLCPKDYTGKDCDKKRSYVCDYTLNSPIPQCESFTGTEALLDRDPICFNVSVYDTIVMNITVHCEFVRDSNEELINETSVKEYDYFVEDGDTFAVSRKEDAPHFMLKVFNFNRLSDMSGTLEHEATREQWLGKEPIILELDFAYLYASRTMRSRVFAGGRSYFEFDLFNSHPGSLLDGQYTRRPLRHFIDFYDFEFDETQPLPISGFALYAAQLFYYANFLIAVSAVAVGVVVWVKYRQHNEFVKLHQS